MEMKNSVKDRLGSCEVCNGNQAKYTCPKCEIHTCSLNCSKIHKKELQCDGIRDRTKYIPLKQMTSVDFMNDYYFLEEATRFTKEIKCNGKVNNIRRLPPKFIKLKKAAVKRNVRLFFINSALSKRKKNFSTYNALEDKITWYVEFIFANANYKTFVKVDENTKIQDTVEAIITSEDNTKRLEFYRAHGASKLQVLLKAEGLKRNQSRYYHLNASKSLKSNLRGKVLIEYPTLYVTYLIDDFELVPSDDEMIELEQRDFVKTLQEEVFSRKTGQNPMLEVKPEEIPIISDLIKDTEEGNTTANTTESNIPVSLLTNDGHENSDEEEISPQNYFF